MTNVTLRVGKFSTLMALGVARQGRSRLDGEGIEERRPQRIGCRLQRGGDTCLLGTQLGEPGVDLLQALGRGGMACLGGLAFGRAGALRLDALGVGLGYRLACGLDS